jgi:hypothetical protein
LICGIRIIHNNYDYQAKLDVNGSKKESIQEREKIRESKEEVSIARNA